MVAPVTEPSHAVFLSYASEDAPAAQRIDEALRAAGIEVWFDKSELRGGDVWDQKIRHQIHDCALFIPIVSQHTQERLEGYFRHEWKLAIERTHHMAEQKAFLIPVVVDSTRDEEAFVPDAFREVQWTRLPAGETPPEFVARIQKLLSGESGHLPTMTQKPAAVTSRRSSRLIAAVLAVVLAAVAAYLIVEKPWTVKSVAFAPPPHSIAVLPFVNMSGDKEQEYFSDGLTEELLNSLARINELQVAASTSSFSFKGKDTDLGTIARKLNVAALLEGSVRRSPHTVRVTAQLINSATGFHLWSESYDRAPGDVLMLQTEIANAVASALKVTLLSEVAPRLELGETRNPAAFDAYLRAYKASVNYSSAADVQATIAMYTKAIELDPHYALAFAKRSIVLARYAGEFAAGDAIRENFDKAEADARQAMTLAPGLAEGHLALAIVLEDQLEFATASKEHEKAVALAPGNAQVIGNYGLFAVLMGRAAAGVAALRRAVVLDPLNPGSHDRLGQALLFARQYDDAVSSYRDLLSLDPDSARAHTLIGLAYYVRGNLQDARSSCERKPGYWQSPVCLSLVYNRLGRRAEAEAQLTKLKDAEGDGAAYQYAQIYAQRGNNAQALEWLQTALRLRDGGMEYLRVDPLLDPIRNEPRFQALERELRFPQ